MSGTGMLELQRTAGNQAASELVAQRDGAASDDSWDGSIKGPLGTAVTYHTINNFSETPKEYEITVRNTGSTLLALKFYFVRDGQADQEWTAIEPASGETEKTTLGVQSRNELHMRFVGETDHRNPDRTQVAGTMSARRTK